MNIQKKKKQIFEIATGKWKILTLMEKLIFFSLSISDFMDD